jgi:hypothetical protein
MEGSMILKGRYAVLALLVALVAFNPATASSSFGSSGDVGWYVVHCNAFGADVYFDEKYMGTVYQGTLTVPAYVYGNTSAASPPFKTIRVSKFGYATYSDSIAKAPEKGENVHLYVTLKELPPTYSTDVGADIGWFLVRCNVDGATVAFDGVSKGTTSQGVVYVQAYSTGTPYRRFSVAKEGYDTFTGDVGRAPGKGETIDLYATLNPVRTSSSPELVGGDKGWYVIHCNEDGAAVWFDNDLKGTTAKGALNVEVYVTGTPYKTFTVKKAGFIPYAATITTYPAKGQTVDLYATLNAAPVTQTTVPPTQKAPFPVWTAVTGLIAICIFATGSKLKR